MAEFPYNHHWQMQPQKYKKKRFFKPQAIHFFSHLSLLEQTFNAARVLFKV
jgi:hypothetical protein